MIRITDLTKFYQMGDAVVHALDGVDLTVEAGEFLSITGASGSGKSTLVRCLGRLIPQCLPGSVSGGVLLGGRSVEGLSVAELSRSIGVVFQNPRTQLFNVRVEDEAAFGPRNLGLDDGEVERRVAWALEAVGLTHLRARTTRTLSGGELQRLAIAAVLAMGPRLLVLDEPLANLDADGTRSVIGAVRRLNEEEGVTCVVVEHRLATAAAVAGRTVLLDHGEVVADGPTGEVLADRPLLDLNRIAYVEKATTKIGFNPGQKIGDSLRTQLGTPLGLPFVVVADGIRIYLGTFFASLSSIGPTGPNASVEDITSDGFTLLAPWRGADPRNDDRILKALTETGKLVP